MEVEDGRTYTKDDYVIPSITLDEHLKEINELTLWLKNKGINSTNSRLLHYTRFLEALIGLDEFDPKNNDDDHKKFEEFLYVLREVHELMWIYNGFKRSYPEGSDELFKKIIGGKAFARDDKDTTARNFQLELRIASYFIRANYAVELQHVTDVVAKKSKYQFFIECKRLSSLKKLKPELKRQLNNLN